MKKIFDAAGRCAAEWDWKDVALLKLCACALGLMAGLLMPRKKKKRCFVIAWLVFTAALIPLALRCGAALQKE